MASVLKGEVTRATGWVARLGQLLHFCLREQDLQRRNDPTINRWVVGIPLAIYVIISLLFEYT